MDKQRMERGSGRGWAEGIVVVVKSESVYKYKLLVYEFGYPASYSDNHVYTNPYHTARSPDQSYFAKAYDRSASST